MWMGKWIQQQGNLSEYETNGGICKTKAKTGKNKQNKNNKGNRQPTFIRNSELAIVTIVQYFTLSTINIRKEIKNVWTSTYAWVYSNWILVHIHAQAQSHYFGSNGQKSENLVESPFCGACACKMCVSSIIYQLFTILSTSHRTSGSAACQFKLKNDNVRNELTSDWYNGSLWLWLTFSLLSLFFLIKRILGQNVKNGKYEQWRLGVFAQVGGLLCQLWSCCWRRIFFPHRR